jgi:hypothetical protein
LVEEYLFASGSEFETEYTFGASYELTPAFRLGVDSFGNFESDKTEFSVGPILSFATEKFYFTTGVAFGATKNSEDVRVRTLIGITL